MANEGIRQIVINVSARDFTIKCGVEFAEFLESDIDLISEGTKKIELKKFVDAFVKKSYENYTLERELRKLVKIINEELPYKIK